MYLRELVLRGFKSFPDRTRLVFGPGVSVIVGPNGSGKSNVTDAVLWALGEQSPLAVRGSSMQDVIFGGGRGRASAGTAEVELVLDNGCGTLGVEFPEVSVLRRLDRTGEGEYRLNGARCRLVDVLEVLSDTGLGKEMHSVVSQGRVEGIVTSRPRDRRLLLEEAAGLGKHRKRRRRAQLKLERTQENLDRALDVEREARGRLRPLKRQAEAALGARSQRREELSGRAYAARGAAERIALRLEAVRGQGAGLAERVARGTAELRALEAEAAGDAGDDGGEERIAALEAERAELERGGQLRLELELAELEERRAAARAEEERRAAEVAARRAAVDAADRACEAARATRGDAERGAEAARREAARVGAELAAVNQFLRTDAGAPGGAARLSEALRVVGGHELALAAALGGALGAAIVPDRAAGAALLERAGHDGGAVLVSGEAAPDAAPVPTTPPAPGARRLLELVDGPPDALALAAPLLADAWVVEDVEAVDPRFRGRAVTPAGRLWSAGRRELRQVPAGGGDRVLAERNRREALLAATEDAAAAERAVQGRLEEATAAVAAADAAREEAEGAARAAGREHDVAAEEERRVRTAMEHRRRAPDEGPGAVRRAQVLAELTAERRLAERAGAEREERRRRVDGVRARLAREESLAPAAAALADALAAAGAAVAARVESFDAELAADRAAGDALAADLRACAQEEAAVQGRLREAGEAVTGSEVAAQRARDRHEEAARELGELAERLELAPEPAAEPLAAEQRDALVQRVERLARRRELLGPVNPLAQDEYAEAVAHLGELEAQREDLEGALRELADLVRDTDRQIRETFEETFAAAARHFEDVAAHLFPGGRGRLRLVREDAGPRPVFGGEEEPVGEEGEDPELGVEIEITPAGKAMKRLTLLSGGEKSLTALAFLFAVFLARPCPFYILDEVEAALDDANISRFLELVRRYADRAQFIVVTHQKRTMEAADTLYGVSMGGDGVSKVISRRLPPAAAAA